MISPAFLGHQVRRGTPLGSLALSSGSLAALVGVQAVVGRGEVVLTQDDLLESLRHTVGRGQNMPGGDEDPGTTPGNHYNHYKPDSLQGSQPTRLDQNT